MFEAVRPSRLQAPARPLLTAVMTLLAASTLGVVALLAMGRLGIIDAIVFVAAPWMLLAAAFRPDWLLLALIAMPASFTAAIQTQRVLPMIAVALAALLVTRPSFSVGWRTGLAALFAVNVAGYLFVADVGQFATEVNRGIMLNLTYYILLALLAFNLAKLGELDGERLGSALVIGVLSTLVVGLAGYGGGWFESGQGIITRTYLNPMAAAALGVCVARVFEDRSASQGYLGNLLLTALLLFLTIVSLSRATWIAATITIALLAFRSGRRGYVLILMAVIVLALLAPTVRQEISRSESGDIFAQARTGAITTGRWKLWTELWQRAEPALPWGHGFGYVWSLSSEDLFGSPGEFQSEESGVVPPHNDFVYLFVEFGIPGVLLLLLFWVQLFRAQGLVAGSTAPLIARSGSLLLGALVTGLIFALFDDVFAVRPIAERFFPVAGFIFGLAEMERARRRSQPVPVVGHSRSAAWRR